jgi:hypothetical protein
MPDVAEAGIPDDVQISSQRNSDVMYAYYK